MFRGVYYIFFEKSPDLPSFQTSFWSSRNGPRKKRNMKDPDIEHFFESPLDKEIAEANSDIDKNKARKYLSILMNCTEVF